MQLGRKERKKERKKKKHTHTKKRLYFSKYKLIQSVLYDLKLLLTLLKILYSHRFMNLHTAIWLSVGIINLKPLSCGIHMTGISGI